MWPAKLQAVPCLIIFQLASSTQPHTPLVFSFIKFLDRHSTAPVETAQNQTKIQSKLKILAKIKPQIANPNQNRAKWLIVSCRRTAGGD